MRYTPAQAIAAGAALIACAAVADADTGGTLTPILPPFPPPTSPRLDRGRRTDEGHRVMTNNPDLTAQPDETNDGQHALTAPRLLAALTLIGDLDPVIADVLRNLHLRVYPGHTARRLTAATTSCSTCTASPSVPAAAKRLLPARRHHRDHRPDHRVRGQRLRRTRPPHPMSREGAPDDQHRPCATPYPAAPSLLDVVSTRHVLDGHHSHPGVVIDILRQPHITDGDRYRVEFRGGITEWFWRDEMTVRPWADERAIVLTDLAAVRTILASRHHHRRRPRRAARQARRTLRRPDQPPRAPTSAATSTP